MDTSKFGQTLQDEFLKYKALVEKPNIILIGATGVGKSSLINHCFGKQLATVGTGLPVTECIDSFSCDSIPVVLFDTKGYEIGSKKEREFLEDVVSYAAKSDAVSNPIHIAWYCIQASGGRIVDFDVEIIKKLLEHRIPVAIVLTKAELISEEDSNEFRKVIKSLLPEVDVFETSTKDNQRTWQFDDLCKWSIEELPESLKVAFASAQRKNLSIKKIEAFKIIKQHSIGSGAVGFVPIPFSDAPILVANQAAMVARILFVYNLQAFSDVLGSSLITSIIGTAISRSGIWVAGQLLKLIPGPGTAVGGLINATVASSLTYAIGTSASALCENLYEKALDGDLDGLHELIKNATPYFEKQFAQAYAVNKGVGS